MGTHRGHYLSNFDEVVSRYSMSSTSSARPDSTSTLLLVLSPSSSSLRRFQVRMHCHILIYCNGGIILRMDFVSMNLFWKHSLSPSKLTLEMEYVSKYKVSCRRHLNVLMQKLLHLIPKMLVLSRTVEFCTKMKDTSRCSRGLFLTFDTICGFFLFLYFFFCYLFV